MDKVEKIIGVPWDSHSEMVRCPKCRRDVIASVIHTLPFWSYVHTCQCCGYVIMESEWENRGRIIQGGMIVETTTYAFDYPIGTALIKRDTLIILNGRQMVVTDTEPRGDGWLHIRAVPTNVKLQTHN